MGQVAAVAKSLEQENADCSEILHNVPRRECATSE